MACRNLAEHRQQRLKTIPPAELVDDQPVFHERSILERRRRIRAPHILVGEKPASERAVTEKTDAVVSAERGHPFRWAPIQDGILHLVRDDGNAGGDDLPEAL